MPDLALDWRRAVEILGVITGLLSVYYAVKEDNRTWSIGIVNALLFGVMFFVDRYYVNVGLQALYVAYNLYSWRMWLHGGLRHTPPAPSATPRAAWLPLLLAVAAFTAVFGWVFATFTDGLLTYWDALTTALSLVAQYALTRKWLENWWIWIAANCLYIGLGLASGSYWFAALQVAYIALSASGWARWRSEISRQPASATSA
jgi:nicotinamide mononucleotide transporter PnuC